MPSRFRGPLEVASTVSGIQGVPAHLLAPYIGRHKIILNNFHELADVAVGANAKLTQTDGAGTPTQTIVVQPGTGADPYGLIPTLLTTGGDADAEVRQWVQGASNQGFGAGGLAGGLARNYDPPLVLTFATEVCATAAAINAGSYAVGFLETNSVVLDAAGVPGATTASGLYFRIPQGAGGVSGALQAIWASAAVGGLEQSITFSPAVNLTALVPLRLAIRFVIKRVTAAAAPLFLSDDDYKMRFYVNDRLVLPTMPFAGSANGGVPLDIGPGLCTARIAGSIAGFRIPYWFATIGPMRAGATVL